MENLIAENSPVDLSLNLHDEWLLDEGLILFNGFRKGSHLLDSFSRGEDCAVVRALATLGECFLGFFKAAMELFIISARETEEAAGVGADVLDLEALCWEMSAFNKEHLVNIGWNSWEELYAYIKLILEVDKD